MAEDLKLLRGCDEEISSLSLSRTSEEKHFEFSFCRLMQTSALIVRIERNGNIISKQKNVQNI